MNLEDKYNEYIKGNIEYFGDIYKEYNKKIIYFIYNIINDYDKAEDLAQDTFIYLMNEKRCLEVPLKYHIYLVAKSKAYNYINVEKRRSILNQKYSLQTIETDESYILEQLMLEENKIKLLKAIDCLDEKYKNLIYLIDIEEISYKEAAKIFNVSVSNIKSRIHRARLKLKTILLKKEWENMKKQVKVIILLFVLISTLSGLVYAGLRLYNLFNTNHKINMNPAYQTELDSDTKNNLWVGTLELAWNELKKELDIEEIELEGTQSWVINDLNNSKFNKTMLDENNYEISIERTDLNGYKIYTKLNKQLSFIVPLDNLSNDYPNLTFGNSELPIKYFGITKDSMAKMRNSVEVLFYNKSKDGVYNQFAVKLRTKENDEIILYRTDEDKSFDDYYEEINKFSNEYIGSKEFEENDELRVPFVRVNGSIHYTELYNKIIKETNGLYIYDMVQDVNFSLTEKGCNMFSNSTMLLEYLTSVTNLRQFYFDDTFIIFMKEAGSDIPYFALKVDDVNILEKIEEKNLPKIVDYTVIEEGKHNVEKGNYKFFEDDIYKYYYNNHRSKLVVVYFKSGEIMTVEEALKIGKIDITLLDEYGVTYIKEKK